MSWSRSVAAPAIAQALQVVVGESVFVFEKPPQTVNPPALIVGRPTEVRFAQPAFGVDAVVLPITCVGPADGEDYVDYLITSVRQAFPSPTNLNGAVGVVYADSEQNWRNVNLAGVDLLLADVLLAIQM